MGKNVKPERIVNVIRLGGRKISTSDFDGYKDRSVGDFRKALRILASKKIFPQPNYIVNE